MRSKRLGVGLITAVLIATTGIMFGKAGAWPEPIVTSDDCVSWTVTETAPNYDWEDTEYWTIDGVAGHFSKGQSVNVPDDSSNTSRSFTVRWYDDDDHQLDSRSKTGNRVLEGCTPPPTPEPTSAYNGSVDCEGMVSGGGSVNRDGLEGNLVVTVNGLPASVVGDNFTFTGAAQPLNVVVMIGDTNVPVEGALTGPPPGSCDEPEPEPDPDPVPEPVPPTL